LFPRRKPAPPTAFRIFLRDNLAVGVAVIAAILIGSSLYVLLSTPEHRRDESLWRVFNLFFYLPLVIATPFLLWRVPRRLRHIQAVWEKGDYVIGEVTGLLQGTRRMPNVMHYRYLHGGETYEKSEMVGKRWRPRTDRQLPLIVNPDQPEDVLIVELYQ
jgi:hypothetical protein